MEYFCCTDIFIHTENYISINRGGIDFVLKKLLFNSLNGFILAGYCLQNHSKQFFLSFKFKVEIMYKSNNIKFQFKYHKLHFEPII